MKKGYNEERIIGILLCSIVSGRMAGGLFEDSAEGLGGTEAGCFSNICNGKIGSAQQGHCAVDPVVLYIGA